MFPFEIIKSTFNDPFVFVVFSVIETTLSKENSLCLRLQF